MIRRGARRRVVSRGRTFVYASVGPLGLVGLVGLVGAGLESWKRRGAGAKSERVPVPVLDGMISCRGGVGSEVREVPYRSGRYSPCSMMSRRRSRYWNSSDSEASSTPTALAPTSLVHGGISILTNGSLFGMIGSGTDLMPPSMEPSRLCVYTPFRKPSSP